MVATITSKGQLVVPKAIREQLHLGPGDKVDFVVQGTGEVIFRPLTCDIMSLRGIVKHKRKRPVSIEEMDKAIARNAARGCRR